MRRARILVIFARTESLMLKHSLDHMRVGGAKECHSGLSRLAESMRVDTLLRNFRRDEVQVSREGCEPALLWTSLLQARQTATEIRALGLGYGGGSVRHTSVQPHLVASENLL